jgi:hypothetical protein
MDNSDNAVLGNIIKANFGNGSYHYDHHYDHHKNSQVSTILLIIFLIWALLGLIAFITSIVCFVRSGSLLDKIIGLLLALFFGPLYFLFFGFNSSYCK